MTNSANNRAPHSEATAPAGVASLRERLAEIEHQQWCDWSKNLAESESISPERLAAWHRRWVPYTQLSEADKDLDRAYADMVLEALRQFAGDEGHS